MAVDTEKVYDCLIIGATFAAMGISAVLNEKCLIAERGLLAGYEFFNALNFGENYESPLRNEQSHELLNAFEEKGVFESGEIRLERAVSAYYSLLKNKNVLMNTSVVSKRKKGFYTPPTVWNIKQKEISRLKTILYIFHHARLKIRSVRSTAQSHMQRQVILNDVHFRKKKRDLYRKPHRGNTL